MDTLDPGTRRPCHNLLRFGAGTDVTERRANPLQPALGARMTFVARPHTPSNYRATERPSDRATAASRSLAGARELRAGNAAAIPRQSRSPGDGSGAGVGAQWQKKASLNVGSERNFGEQLANICRGFLFFSRVPIGRIFTRSAKSLVPIGSIFSSRCMKDP